MKCDATVKSFAVEYEPGDPDETGKHRKARHRRLNIECYKCSSGITTATGLHGARAGNTLSGKPMWAHAPRAWFG